MRSVFFTLCLLVLIIYVFAIAFTQLTGDLTQVHNKYFDGVFKSMCTLLLYGTLPDQAPLVYNVGDVHFGLAVLMMCFILLATLTVLNMLVGVLVEVVQVVSSVEREALVVGYVKDRMLELMRDTGFDTDSNEGISREEFRNLIIQPEAARVIQEVGVDCIGLVDYIDFIFKDSDKISFASLMELVLQLRGTNPATVRDIVDLRKFVLQELANELSTLEHSLKESLLGAWPPDSKPAIEPDGWPSFDGSPSVDSTPGDKTSGLSHFHGKTIVEYPQPPIAKDQKSGVGVKNTHKIFHPPAPARPRSAVKPEGVAPELQPLRESFTKVATTADGNMIAPSNSVEIRCREDCNIVDM